MNKDLRLRILEAVRVKKQDPNLICTLFSEVLKGYENSIGPIPAVDSFTVQEQSIYKKTVNIVLEEDFTSEQQISMIKGMLYACNINKQFDEEVYIK